MRCILALLISPVPESDPGFSSGEIAPPPVLQNINLTIQPGEKLAICGRTGSGKSSFLALLLKPLDPLPSSGSDREQPILIDHLPLHRIHRASLRQNLIAVLQDSVFLADGASLRANLELSNIATQAECRNVLEAVHLWSFVQDRGDLHASVLAWTFSTGQRQLFSLGRAVLRVMIWQRSTSPGIPDGDQWGILFLDEVSSNVEREAEGMMQIFIREEFRRYTIYGI